MADSPPHSIFRAGRRRALKAAAALAATPLVARFAHAQQPDLGPYLEAKLNWRQAEGESIAVAVTTAGYFDNLVALTPQFEALTGIKVRYDRISPNDVRQKGMADLAGKTGTYATAATDPMYYPLYASKRWIEPLDAYLDEPSLTDVGWFRYYDVLRAWRDANTVGGLPYGIAYEGEVTVQVYRKDLYDALGLKPAETISDYLRNAQAVHDPSNGLWGTALRGLAGAGQNMYIYPSIFRSFGGKWLVDGRIRVNSPAALGSLDWYVHVLRKYAPIAVRNWNWPEVAEAFALGRLGTYIDGTSTAAVSNDPGKSKVIGKIGYARWPRGPTGKRVASIWNWGFPINAALNPRAKRATWLFIAWATCEETQARTSWKFPGAVKRSGVNRLALWRNPGLVALLRNYGHNFVETALESFAYDTDVDWRPRVPQWPAIGETMGAAIHAVLVGEKKSKAALDEAQSRIDQVMKG